MGVTEDFQEAITIRGSAVQEKQARREGETGRGAVKQLEEEVFSTGGNGWTAGRAGPMLLTLWPLDIFRVLA